MIILKESFSKSDIITTKDGEMMFSAMYDLGVKLPYACKNEIGSWNVYNAEGKEIISYISKNEALKELRRMTK